MKLYLMQHGKYLPEEQDPEKGLSPEGKKEIQIAGKVLKAIGASLDLVAVSTKKRSKETGAIIADYFSVSNIEESEALNPKASIEEAIAFIRGFSSTSLFIAGHLPSLQLLAQYLLAEKLQIDFEMGACCLIETEDFSRHQGHLKWFIPPSLWTKTIS